MIPIAANIPLTLCSVVIRRCIDSYTRRLPLAVASRSISTTSTVAVLSGAFVCLYHQLRRGTLLPRGVGRRVSAVVRNSRHTIQRRIKRPSWFLRNLTSCRQSCAEAILGIAQPADDSLDQIQAETGAVENDGAISGTTSLPTLNRRHCSRNRRFVKHSKKPPVKNLYRSFDSNDHSDHDIRLVDVDEQGEEGKSKNNNENVQGRPITRNFRKSLLAKAGCGDESPLLPKMRKRIEDTPPAKKEDCCQLDKESSDYLSPLSLTPINKVRSPYGQSSSSNTSSRRHSDPLEKQRKRQKVTRQTRSGKVY
ncbi:uncharacterized protein LOC125502470 isoform X2 [Dendroctonus ponderosae]|uniref:uncharacterized protein LOC125502470 isoform X2 n=1 Tax=Dendroctonus ponderosae TaxID=77166 RepID=UPI0020356574|nr:uncharacterized protein LOC125502470 isoform X2 [Dendroctonus ponderosae]KAH1027863.1 hypothetical protein HUJ05_001294 [Dendroctonus ponderosae]